eukprot:1137796-Pelagomonas_calceolata.AAC.5
MVPQNSPAVPLRRISKILNLKISSWTSKLRHCATEAHFQDLGPQDLIVDLRTSSWTLKEISSWRKPHL